MSEDKDDKGKYILGAPPEVVRKETKQNNHRSTNKKSQLRKPQISMDSTLLLIHRIKGLCKRKVLHPGLPSGRKKILSDSFTFLISCMVGCYGLS